MSKVEDMAEGLTNLQKMQSRIVDLERQLLLAQTKVRTVDAALTARSTALEQMVMESVSLLERMANLYPYHPEFINNPNCCEQCKAKMAAQQWLARNQVVVSQPPLLDNTLPKGEQEQRFTERTGELLAASAALIEGAKREDGNTPATSDIIDALIYMHQCLEMVVRMAKKKDGTNE